MCYPKPGPRCSSHASLKVVEAQREYLLVRQKGRNFDDMNKVLKKLEKAREEFSLTPAGLAELKAGADDGSEHDAMRYELCKKLREEKIKLVKSKTDNVSDKHKVNSDGHYAYENNQLTANNGEVLCVEPSHPDIDNMLKQSMDWAQQLEPEEIAAIRNYTRADYADVNGFLSSNTYELTRSNKDKVEKSIAHLDSALAKAQEQPNIVYRRHFFYKDDGSFASLSPEVIEQRFAEGSIYEPGFYLSTSMDPQNIESIGTDREETFVAAFEIKTKKAAAIGAIHAGSMQELEFLTARNAKFKVISNSKTIIVNDKKSGERTAVNVIQLEEL